MEINKVVVGPLRTNCYILIKDNKCLVIDPGDELDKIKKEISKKEVVGVIVTHYHFDHIGALNYFDKDLILQAVKYLENGDYISVKYADDEKFCLCPLPFGRQFMENEANHAKNKKEIKKIGSKIYFFALFCALIGSFLGTLLYDLFFRNLF